jgi:hypothetical protein
LAADAFAYKVELARRTQRSEKIQFVLSIVGGLAGLGVSFRLLYWGAAWPVLWSVLAAVVIGAASFVATLMLALEAEFRFVEWRRDFEWRRAERAVAIRNGAPPPSELRGVVRPFLSFIAGGAAASITFLCLYLIIACSVWFSTLVAVVIGFTSIIGVDQKLSKWIADYEHWKLERVIAQEVTTGPDK